MSPRDAARLVALGRVGFGVLMFAAPKLMRRWLGVAVETPGGQVAVRAVGARDILLGALTLHTLDTEAGPRFVAACGVADVGDVAATLLARGTLSSSGVTTGVAVGGGAAATSFAAAAAMARA